jgi:hypothetical protein
MNPAILSSMRLSTVRRRKSMRGTLILVRGQDLSKVNITFERFSKINTGVKCDLCQHELSQILRKWPDIDASFDIPI